MYLKSDFRSKNMNDRSCGRTYAPFYEIKAVSATKTKNPPAPSIVPKTGGTSSQLISGASHLGSAGNQDPF